MFSFLTSFLLFFIVIAQPINAQLAEESTPSAQTIEITPTPTFTPTETPTLIPTITSTPSPEIVESEPVKSPQITTDKVDYSPTDMAIISGNNFPSNTQYILNITSDNLNVNYQVISDESGSFIYNYQLDGNYRPNYKVEVKDLNNNLISVVTFTDRRSVLSATVNGQTSINVFSGESIAVGVSVNTDWWWFWNNDWRSTSWRYGNSGEWNCVDTPNHLKSGDYSEYFSINAPINPKKYQLQIRIHGLENCGILFKSDIFTLKDAIIVSVPDTTPPIITINSYNTNLTNQNITISASTNEGTLNFTSHTFESNSSFTFIATDGVGNTATETVTINNIDKTPPTLLNKTEFGNSWYNTDQLSIFNFTDENGVTSGNNPTCQISNEGSLQTCSVNLNVCDTVGNCNTDLVFSNGANIDKIKPILNFSITPSSPNANNNWYKTQPEINLINTENNPFLFQYKWDSENNWTNYNSCLKPSFEGSHTLYFQSQDLAGNQKSSFMEIKWDQTEPSIGPQNIIANPNNTSSSVSTIKWNQATDNIGIDKYEARWTLNDPNNPISYSKTVGSDIREIEINNLIEGRWTVQVFAVDPSGLKKDNSIDLFVIKNNEIISSDIPIKTVFVAKKSSTTNDLLPTISPVPTSTPTVLGTSITKKKFNFKWLLLFLPIFFIGYKVFKKK